MARKEHKQIFQILFLEDFSYIKHTAFDTARINKETVYILIVSIKNIVLYFLVLFLIRQSFYEFEC